MNNSTIMILIADDDLDDALMLTDAIHYNLSSAICTHVTNGALALEHIENKKTPPDMIFLDINMPLKNGISCLKDIHGLKMLPDTPVIICSTSDHVKDVNDAFKYAASAYIVKPDSFKELCILINKVITRVSKSRLEQVNWENFVLKAEKHTS